MEPRKLAFVLLLFASSAQAQSRVEISLGFSFNHTNYGGENYSWMRRWGFGAGYHLTDLSEIEFAFQDVIDRTKITNYEDTTFHDQIYSLNWVQSFLPRTAFLQPYVKGGIGQLNREATGQYAGGSSPPTRVDSLTAIVGLGARIFVTRSVALRIEGTSYLTGARIGTWKDNYAFTVGGSVYFF